MLAAPNSRSNGAIRRISRPMCYCRATPASRDLLRRWLPHKITRTAANGRPRSGRARSPASATRRSPRVPPDRPTDRATGRPADRRAVREARGRRSARGELTLTSAGRGRRASVMSLFVFMPIRRRSSQRCDSPRIPTARRLRRSREQMVDLRVHLFTSSLCVSRIGRIAGWHGRLSQGRETPENAAVRHPGPRGGTVHRAPA